MIKSVQIFLVCLMILVWFNQSHGIPPKMEMKKILLINSYHQGYAWTDSLSAGIIQTVKEDPGIILFIETLNSKQFGQSRFEQEKEYLKEKYRGSSFSGVLVTDNDALDFAFRYDSELFPGVPVVFAGISNPEEYPLEGSLFYGYKETGDSRQVLILIRQLLPESRRLFVITDKTTTGMIYRKEFTDNAGLLNGFSVMFPEVVDLDSIYNTVASGANFDAIFYAGINQDQLGQLVDPVPVIQKISQLAKVPVFTNDPQNSCQGILGGLFRNGGRHGEAAVDLLIKLIDKTSVNTIKHINTTGQRFFFDRHMLDKYKIPIGRLPVKSSVFNQKSLFSRENFIILLVVLTLLCIALIVLTVNNQKRKREQRRSRSQLRRVENQKDELENAYEKLGIANATLEDTNMRLNDSNIKLLEAKKKAEESDRLKSAFLANVSHEIRTPLNSIVGFSSLLADSRLNEETRKGYIELVESNTESLLVLIDEIIDLSKIEAQQLSINKQQFSVDDLIGELFLVFTREQKNNQVELVVSKVSGLKELFVFSDRVRVKQIFINLLSNAFKFTEAGTIEIGYMQPQNSGVVLYVKDSGIGIHKDHHQVIFHRFRKLNENHSKKLYRGTGLGLAITEKLIELLGGKIWIESELGVGSVFYFTLQDLELREKEA